jgi:hypothetical protein
MDVGRCAVLLCCYHHYVSLQRVMSKQRLTVSCTTLILTIYHSLACSIGYGDLTPHSEHLKAFAVIFIPLSVGAMGHFLGTVANFVVEQRTRVYDKRLWKHELTLADLESISRDHCGTVTELDFVVFMLKAMKKVDADLIDKIREHFRRLDLTHSGTLERGDLELMARQKLRSARSKLRLSSYKHDLVRQGSASFYDDKA